MFPSTRTLSETARLLKFGKKFSLLATAESDMNVKKIKLENFDTKKEENKTGRATSFASLEIISNGTAHTAPCVVLKTDQKTYLFNCPEGTCRFQSSIRLRPITTHDYFITRGSWDCFGGISALLMSKDDLSQSSPLQCRLHGPKGIRQYLDELRPFMDPERKSYHYCMIMEERSYERGSYKDEILSVQYISLVGLNHTPDREDVDIAYLVELTRPPMKVDCLKIIELKIPPGPLIGKLKGGNTVVLPDGRTIEPEQIYADQQIGRGKSFLVADVVSEEKLNCLIKSNVMQKYIDGSEQLGYIVHFTQREMFVSENYNQWMKAFGEECEHIVVNGSGVVAPQIEAPYMQQIMLNTLDPIAFPLLYPKDFRGVIVQDNGGESLAPNVFVPTSLRRYLIRGNLPSTELIVFSFDDSFMSSRINIAPKSISLIEEFHEFLNSITDREENKYPQITFLGTSSAMYTRYRNLSGHLLQLNENSFILIDCGELTYGQIKVLYGKEECERILINLHTICITHAHQDHLNGLILLLEKRENAFKKHELTYKPVILVSSLIVLRPLNLYSDKFRDIRGLVKYVDAAKLVKPSSMNTQKEYNPMIHFPGDLYNRDEWNLANIESVKVIHVAHSFAFIFTDAIYGRKVVFSGDTMPCDMLVQRGKNCDILVHEATFQDHLKDDAQFKKHSTMEQAVNVGCRMNARHVILTHFSARYNKVPMLPDYLLNAGNVSIAMDNMVVRFDRLDVFPKLLPIYRQLYMEELLKADEKTVKICCRDPTI